MRSPHLLMAAGNCRKLHKNLVHLVDAAALQAIESEIARNSVALFLLGETHLSFAKGLQRGYWRQIVSRSYYGAYNVLRGVRLFVDGSYSTDGSDHKRVDKLPEQFPNINAYSIELPVLRDDRNLCDYDHSICESDLATPPADAIDLAGRFVADARGFLKGKGLVV